jgi:phage terminase large subunit-like protein
VREAERFAGFCSGVLTDPNGRPIVLYPEQLEALEDFFDGCRETVLLQPKKSGKTGLAAALALDHLLTTPFAECFIAAASRDQAARVLDALGGYVRRSPELSQRVRLKQREAIHDGNSGFIRVLAADTDTSDGVTPTLAIVDELHRHRSAELYTVLRDGLGPRDGRMVTISTAGDSEDTPLGKLRTKAYELDGLEHDGAHRFVTTGDFAFHEWALGEDADVHDLDLVKTANPAPWISVDELRRRHDSPSTQEWAWRRFACGQWVQGEFSAFQALEWAACAEPGLVIPDGARGPYVGVDLGYKWDTTAIVPVWITGGGWKPGTATSPRNPRLVRRVWVRDEEQPVAYVGTPTILEPPGDGTSLSVEAIFDACRSFADRYPEPTFVLDPLAGGEHLAQRLDAELKKARVATWSQANSTMIRASQGLAEMIAAGRLKHPDDPVLNAHLLACGVRQVGEGWRLAKQPGSRAPIDAAVALAMALAAGIAEGASDEPPKEPPGGYKAGGW